MICIIEIRPQSSRRLCPFTWAIPDAQRSSLRKNCGCAGHQRTGNWEKGHCATRSAGAGGFLGHWAKSQCSPAQCAQTARPCAKMIGALGLHQSICTRWRACEGSGCCGTACCWFGQEEKSWQSVVLIIFAQNFFFFVFSLKNLSALILFKMVVSHLYFSLFVCYFLCVSTLFLACFWAVVANFFAQFLYPCTVLHCGCPTLPLHCAELWLSQLRGFTKFCPLRCFTSAAQCPLCLWTAQCSLHQKCAGLHWGQGLLIRLTGSLMRLRIAKQEPADEIDWVFDEDPGELLSRHTM